jgi:hypothetical protein
MDTPFQVERLNATHDIQVASEPKQEAVYRKSGWILPEIRKLMCVGKAKEASGRLAY